MLKTDCLPHSNRQFRNTKYRGNNRIEIGLYSCLLPNADKGLRNGIPLDSCKSLAFPARFVVRGRPTNVANEAAFRWTHSLFILDKTAMVYTTIFIIWVQQHGILHFSQTKKTVILLDNIILWFQFNPISNNRLLNIS